MKDLINKFRNGEGITDEELNKLIEYYSTLTILLKEQGEIGHIYWSYFYMELQTLLSFKRARQND